MKRFILIIPLFLLCLCGWSNDRDNPDEPVKSWNSGSGPVIIDSSLDSLTFKWRHLKRASEYRIYNVNNWGPPVDETFVQESASNICRITVSGFDAERVYRVKALDSDENILDYMVIKGFYSRVTPGYFSGILREDFNNSPGLSEERFYLNTFDGDPASADLSADNVRIDLNSDGINIYFGYDPEGKRFTRLNLKFYQYHKQLNSYGAGLSVISYSNNTDNVIVGHSCYITTESAGIEYYRYDDMDSEPDKINSALNSSPRFGEEFERTLIIDSATGDITVIEAGIVTNKSLPWKFSSKLIFSITVWSTGSGDYLTVDDLTMESSDEPF